MSQGILSCIGGFEYENKNSCKYILYVGDNIRFLI